MTDPAPRFTLRVLIGKPGLDGHDRGAKIIARALRDAGFEVIYTGLHQTPEQIVATAIQEDVDCIGLSVLSGAHEHLFSEVLRLLRERQAEDIFVGVLEVFTPGTRTDEVVAFLRSQAAARRGGEPG
jgi:methylmalonyl-CoA mutase C-terminal domain/subunit